MKSWNGPRKSEGEMIGKFSIRRPLLRFLDAQPEARRIIKWDLNLGERPLEEMLCMVV